MINRETGGKTMIPGIHNYSEIGKLNKVLLHRPGLELEALTPATMERLLFDDIPYLKVAQQEHDRFAEVLRENGVEVVYYVEETAKALSTPQLQQALIEDFLDLSLITSQGMRESLISYLMTFDPKTMVAKLIAGIKKNEVPSDEVHSLMDLIHDDYPYISDPMPNLYFTRDPGACLGDGIDIHHMHTQERRRESLLLKYMYKYNRDFATEENKQWYDLSEDYSIEGGDVLVLSKDMVAVGLSQRTTIAGIERLAKNLLPNSTFQKVLVFDIPKTRAFMHLDTVFTMVDYDKFTIHPEIEGPLGVYEITLGKGGELKFNAMKDELQNILALELGIPAVELIRCGGGDLLAAQREQWNDGSNTLCIAPGTVVTYERNYVSNELLDKKGVKVLSIPSAELSRGRGGPRCMSCPVNRVDL
jgi:arginine deiminase